LQARDELREQFRSNTFRGGEPPSHVNSSKAVTDLINQHKGFFASERRLILFPDGHTHEYDIIVYMILDDPEGGQIERKVLFIEIGDIGDDSRHNPGHKEILINDGINKAHVEKYFPYARYLKINKDDAFIRSHVLGLLRLDDIRTNFQSNYNPKSQPGN
jgi:hypothetical protein